MFGLMTLLLSIIWTNTTGFTLGNSKLTLHFRLSSKNVKESVGLVGNINFGNDLLLNSINNKNYTYVVGCNDCLSFKRRLISRSLRYSGLFDRISVKEYDSSKSSLSNFLSPDLSAIIAFNISSKDVDHTFQAILKSQIKRAVVTVSLNDGFVPQVDFTQFDKAGKLVTVLFHRDINHWEDENEPYYLKNGSVMENTTISLGVLGKVTSELLRSDYSWNVMKHIGNGQDFEKAYIEALHGAGMSRSDEVRDIFSGRMEEMKIKISNKKLLDEIDSPASKNETEQDSNNEVVGMEDFDLKSFAMEEPVQSADFDDPRSFVFNAELHDVFPSVKDDDQQSMTIKEAVEKRAEEIIDQLYQNFRDSQILTETTKMEFRSINIPKALKIAESEFKDRIEDRIEIQMNSSKKAEIVMKAKDHLQNHFDQIYSLDQEEKNMEKNNARIFMLALYNILKVAHFECKSLNYSFGTLSVEQQKSLLYWANSRIRQHCQLYPQSYPEMDLIDAEIIAKNPLYPIPPMSSSEIQLAENKDGIEMNTKILLCRIEREFGKSIGNFPNSFKNIFKICSNMIRETESSKKKAPSPDAMRRCEILSWDSVYDRSYAAFENQRHENNKFESSLARVLVSQRQNFVNGLTSS